jgi:hypothetical protein
VYSCLVIRSLIGQDNPGSAVFFLSPGPISP